MSTRRTTDTTARDKLEAARIPAALKAPMLAAAESGGIVDAERRAARRRNSRVGDAGRRKRRSRSRT